jgi:hypothetical protein
MNAECQFWLNWWVNLAIAFGTISAVVLALFSDALRTRFIKSKLGITLYGDFGEKTRIQYKYSEVHGKDVIRELDAYYFRLKIQNYSKWQISNQTQALLISVQQLDENNIYKMIWNGEVPLGWMHGSLYPVLRTIGPPAVCDLFNVQKNSHLQLLPLITPNSMQAVYKSATTLVFSIIAQGNEGQSPIFRIKMVWDGEWDDDINKMKNHLRIEDVSAQQDI